MARDASRVDAAPIVYNPIVPKVSVVVVSFNTREKLLKCLEAIEASCGGIDTETIVVDNTSKDGSADMVAERFPAVQLIRNSVNRGFGSANNQGLDLAQSELVLFLNSDAYAIGPAIPNLAHAFQDSSIVAAGGKLLNPDGSLQQSCANELTLWSVFCEQSFLERLFPSSSFFSPYWMSRRLPRGGDVEQLMGACLMMRPVERFDERFFLYCEDTDLCKRLRKHGRILYAPDAAFTHELGSSSVTERWKSVARYNRGKEIYFAIHHGRLSAKACWLLNRLGAMLRLFAWGLPTLFTLGLVARLRRQAVLFLKVLFAPIAGPPQPQS